MSVSQSTTAEELFRMPRDGWRYELLAGEIKKMSPTGGYHADIEMQLGMLLRIYVQEKGLGKVIGGEPGFILAREPDTVRAPDIAFIAEERLETVQFGVGFCVGPPDLAVEIVSPSTTVHEMEEKVADWLDAATRLVWVVNGKRKTVTVHRAGRQPQMLGLKDQLTGEEVIPGFTCQVADVFR